MSETDLVDSTSPMGVPGPTSSPTSGSWTKTMSPRASWAWSVIPTRTTVAVPSVPCTSAHSCWSVYRRSSGVAMRRSSPGNGWRARAGCCGSRRWSVPGRGGSVLRRVEWPQCVDDDVLELGDLHRPPDPGDPLHHSPGDVHRRLHVLRGPDHQELEGRSDRPPVDHQVAGVAGDRCGDPDADPVDLHRLGAGSPECLDRVEDVGDADLVARIPDGHPQPRSVGGDRPVEDADRLG